MLRYMKTLYARWQMQRNCNHAWVPMNGGDALWGCRYCGKQYDSLEAQGWARFDK